MVLVSISDILDVVSEFKRPLVEGERILEANLLIQVGRLADTGSSDEDLLIIWALCLQSSTILESPHVIKIRLDMKTIYNRVKSVECSCKAGESEKCKHVVACLMYLNKILNVEDLEEISCTDIEQQWGKLKTAVKSDFEAVPFRDYCHFHDDGVPIYSRGTHDVDDKKAEEFAKYIAAEDPRCESSVHTNDIRAARSLRNIREDVESAASNQQKAEASTVTTKLLERRMSPLMETFEKMTADKVEGLSVELAKFYRKFVTVSKEKCVEIAVETCTQSEVRWFKERRYRITGSKCYSLFTYSSNKNPVWDQKIKSTFQSSFSGNEHTNYGLPCENIAKDLFKSKYDEKVADIGLYVHPAVPWLGYSSDGIIIDDSFEPQYLLEIKSEIIGKTNPASKLFELASCCNQKLQKLKKKYAYYGQVQLGMFLLGLPSCAFALYSSYDKDIATETVLFDEEFVFQLVSKILDVYFDHALTWFHKNTCESSAPGDD